MKPIDRFSVHLKQLTDQAMQFDQSSRFIRTVSFDSRLFTCHSKKLSPYVLEAKTTLSRISTEYRKGAHATDVIEYLSEILLNQINAINKELIAHNLDIQSSLFVEHALPEPLIRLQTQLTQHLAWEKRLVQLVQEKAELFRTATTDNRNKAQQVLKATEERLIRCQQSKYLIEEQINKRGYL